MYLPEALDMREVFGGRRWPAARELRLQTGEKESVVLEVAEPGE